MRLLTTLGAALGVLMLAGGIESAEKLKADIENSKITFVGGKPDGTTHSGGFKKFKIDATRDADNPGNSTLRIEIDTASLFADNPKLESHLKNPDFFDVRKYSTAVFESTNIEADEDSAVLTGKLKLLDKTQELKVPATVEHTDSSTTITAKFNLDRTKWGMDYGIEQNVTKINKEVEITAVLKFLH